MYVNKMSIASGSEAEFATIRILCLPESAEGVATGQTTALMRDLMHDHASDTICRGS